MSESLKAVSGKDLMSQSAEVLFIIICFNDGKAFLGPAQHNGLSPICLCLEVVIFG